MKNLLILLLALFTLQSNATVITIGTSSNTNTATQYPAPYGNWFWGAKHQILILSSELNAMGMTSSNINNIAFDVVNNNGVTLQDFTISLKHTNSTSTAALETGLTTVFGPTAYTPSDGWNTHSFSTPFNWNGTSNLLIEVCFNNTEYTDNAIMRNSVTSFNSVAYTIDDGPNVCSGNGAAQTSLNRPNMKLDYTLNNTPPSSSFIASTTNTCSGIVGFNDLSTGTPTSWLWDFGDGFTSTSQNPTHTYVTNGTYNVSLTATNAFGSDTETINNYISVNVGAAIPVATNCSPVTLNGSLGFGITDLSLNTINNSSGNASEGYGDFTCQQTTLYAGQTYTMNATMSGPVGSTVAIWIDWNNDGILDDVSEKIFSNPSTSFISFQLTAPSAAVAFDTPLRLRISADYDFSAPPTPCSDSDFGQVEDYTIIVEVDTSPPTTNFSATNLITCNGIVNFEDLSTNVPYAWYWEFGDGNTSIAQNPTHTYLNSGTFEVSLTSTNAFGSNSETKTGFITVNLNDQLTSATCQPVTLGHCCDYGILNVNFNTINNTSHDGVEGYQDFSCDHNTTLTAGNDYAISITTSLNNQDTKVWLDLNNDGSFDNSELILDAPNQTNPFIVYNAPITSATFNTPIRMRVMSDIVGNLVDACSDQTYGQTEDYAVTIDHNISVNDFAQLKFSLFPNPAQNKLNIKHTHEKIESVTILDLMGRVIYKNMQPYKEIDVSILVSGQYLVVLKTATNVGIQKFIKQ